MLTHLDSQGRANMVDVSDKALTVREAVAEALVRMRPQTLQMIAQGDHPKGDVFAVARIAGIQAAKKTSDLIPLCHPLMLTGVMRSGSVVTAVAHRDFIDEVLETAP